jgi:hypothetical protein
MPFKELVPLNGEAIDELVLPSRCSASEQGVVAATVPNPSDAIQRILTACMDILSFMRQTRDAQQRWGDMARPPFTNMPALPRQPFSGSIRKQGWSAPR